MSPESVGHALAMARQLRGTGIDDKLQGRAMVLHSARRADEVLNGGVMRTYGKAAAEALAACNVKAAEEAAAAAAGGKLAAAAAAAAEEEEEDNDDNWMEDAGVAALSPIAAEAEVEMKRGAAGGSGAAGAAAAAAAARPDIYCLPRHPARAWQIMLAMSPNAFKP